MLALGKLKPYYQLMANSNSKAPLPDNYSFVYKDTIAPQEVIALRSASNWGRENSILVWQEAINQSIETVGIRDANELLVGVGFLIGNSRHALLCDFTVHPEHRSQGLGKAILDRRLAIADEAGIAYLYTDISPTNTLRNRYLELGFVASGNIYERKSR
jgi:GNAT superfamily N-acetyltransferase